MLPSLQNISAYEVKIKTGYNFVPVPERVRSILVEYGDLIGWTTNDTNCIKTVQQSGDALYDVMFSSNKSSSSLFVIDGAAQLKNVTFAVKAHGYSTGKYTWRFCNKDVETISLHAMFSNQLSTKKTNVTIIFQQPLEGLSNSGFTQFMVVNESNQFVVKATQGTNLTVELNIPGRQFEHAPYLSRNVTTDGIDYRKNVTFNRSETVHVSFVMFNKVSKISNSFNIVVRLRVLGLLASLTYTDVFVYQGALTNLNTSKTQGDHVIYYWIFENSHSTTNSPTVSYIFKILGKTNITLYAHNSASYMEFIIPAQVIPNPVTLSVSQHVEAGVAEDVGCGLVWSGGSPTKFFQQFNLTGKRGTQAPDESDFVLDFDDGQSVTKNSSEFPIKHTFARKLNQGYSVKCTLRSRPELNIRRSVLAIDKVSGLKINTDCPSSITKNSTCKFEAIVTKGDIKSCRWKVRDGSVTMFLFACSISHTFINGYPAFVVVNVSNPISWLEMNKTFTASKVTTSSVILTPTTIVKSLTQSTISKTTAIPRPSVTISRTIQVSSVLPSVSVSPSSSITSISTISPTLPSIKDAFIECPGNGIVSQAIFFKLSTNVQDKSIQFSWYIDNAIYPSNNRSISQVFQQPGVYNVKCMVTNGQEKVSLSCIVPVQYRIDGFSIKKLEVLKEMLVGVEFEVFGGTNVTHRVDYGDGGL